MEPNSFALPILLALGAGGLLFALVRYRHLAIRITSGVVALTLAGVVGVLIVNDYYGYYQTWSQLRADISDTYQPGGAAAPSGNASSGPVQAGRVEHVVLAGKHSGIKRKGFVYLPPQYFEPAYAHTRFPVAELLHGSPGSPSTWLVHLGIATTADRLIANRLMGPLVLVIPAMNDPQRFEDGVNAPGALDDTYLTDDVRADVLAKYRVSRDPAEWALAGFSSGGYAAANLALRHLTDFGACGVMDGYFRPEDGPAGHALGRNPVAEAANNPLLAAGRLVAGRGPIPAFWLSAGTGDPADVDAARAFLAALRPVQSAPFRTVAGAGHNFYAWEPAIPYLMQWIWLQVAPPSLRVRFPIAATIGTTSVDLTPTLPTPAGSGGPAPSTSPQPSESPNRS